MTEVLRGIGVSSGVAVGRVLRVETEVIPDIPEPIADTETDAEVERFEASRNRARRDLADLRERVLRTIGEGYAGMLDAQLLILDDPSLVRYTVERVRSERVTASWALAVTVEGFLRRFAAIDDEHLQDRGGDLRDVHRRLQSFLRAAPRREGREPRESAVVVAHALGPSETIGLAREGVIGIVTDRGGPTSHLAILAQALGVPAVVGVGDVSRRAIAGDEIVVDGDRGLVHLRPGPDAVRDAVSRRAAWRARESAMAQAARAPVVTRDGVTVTLRANIEFPEETGTALRFGAQGIGLYRSEFLYLARAPELPSEEEHFRTYREILEKAAPHPAVIRTLDLGGEKYFHQVLERGDPNPVLGLRAIRLWLKRPEIFRPQVRGLLRAACHGDLRILVPLVTSTEEIREVRRIVNEEGIALAASGVPARADVPLGVMIETPAAAVTADAMAREADFLSIGSNDLIQYALAVDRGNPAVAYLYDPLHPAVLRMIRFTLLAAARRGIPVSLCGEMAADPGCLPLLLGMGLRELSVPPRALAGLRESVLRVHAGEAAALVARILDSDDADEMRRLLRAAVKEGAEEA